MERLKPSLKCRAPCHDETGRMVSHPCAGIGLRQRGLALITAMLVIAIAFTAVTYMAFNQSVWIHQAQNLIDRTQADAVAYRYIQAAMDLLSEVAIDNKREGIQHDDDKARWSEWPGQDREGWEDKDLEALGGKLTGKITDAQAKFNLNNLLDWRKNPPAESPEDTKAMRRILANLIHGLNGDPVNAMLDWIDRDGDQRPNGAEDLDYTSVAPPRLPYRAANQAFTSMDELRLVQGFNAEIVDTLKEANILIALPAIMNGTTVVPTPVNVNTASDEVLLALFPALTSATLKDFTASRPYKNADEVVAKNPHLTTSGTPAPAIKNYDVSTFYFEVEVTVTIGKIVRKTVALIYRPATPTQPQIVQISHPAVVKPPNKKEPELNKEPELEVDED